METLISVGYYVSSIGFLFATIATVIAVSRFGKSSLGSIFYFMMIGTGIFFVITVFQKLGGEFFRIGDDSMDVWWHIMFYMAFFFYYYAFKLLNTVGNETTQNQQVVKIGSEKMWGIIALVALVIIFVIPNSTDAIALAYLALPIGQLGLHHFLAFMLAAAVGSYLMGAKENLGQIGRAIANPMIVAMWAFAVQHFWELLFESWKVVIVTSEIGEGIEKIFMIIAAIGISIAAMRLISFAKSA